MAQLENSFPHSPHNWYPAVRLSMKSLRYTGAAPPLAPILDGECDLGRSGIVHLQG